MEWANRESEPPTTSGRLSPVPPSDEDLWFTSLNVNGMQDYAYRQQLFQWLKAGGWHVIVLQETHCENQEQGMRWAREAGWHGRTFWSAHPTNPRNTAGVGVLFREGAPVTQLDRLPEEVAGRALIVSFEYDGDAYAVVSVYAHTEQGRRTKFFAKRLLPILKPIHKKFALLLGGDFNCVGSELDVLCERRSSYFRRLVGYMKGLLVVVGRLDLVDTYRAGNPRGRAITFAGPYSAARLDLWLVPKGITSRVNLARACVGTAGTDALMSDHFPVGMALRPRSRGPAQAELPWSAAGGAVTRLPVSPS